MISPTGRRDCEGRCRCGSTWTIPRRIVRAVSRTSSASTRKARSGLRARVSQNSREAHAGVSSASTPPCRCSRERFSRALRAAAEAERHGASAPLDRDAAVCRAPAIRAGNPTASISWASSRSQSRRDWRASDPTGVASACSGRGPRAIVGKRGGVRLANKYPLNGGPTAFPYYRPRQRIRPVRIHAPSSARDWSARSVPICAHLWLDCAPTNGVVKPIRADIAPVSPLATETHRAAKRETVQVLPQRGADVLPLLQAPAENPAGAKSTPPYPRRKVGDCAYCAHLWLPLCPINRLVKPMRAHFASVLL